MKKEIKSYEELLECDGLKFEAVHYGKKVDGVVFVDSNEDVFCLQNYFDGSRPIDGRWKNIGYRYSWVQFCHRRYNITTSENTFTNIVVEFLEDWKPKFGELVEVSTKNDNGWYKRIFIGENDGMFHCVHKDDDGMFKINTQLQHYRCLCWDYIRKIKEPKITVTIEEAREIIAKNKCVKAENVTIKVL